MQFIGNNIITNQKELDLIVNLNNNNIIHFVKMFITLYKNINFSKIPHISIRFSKKYNYNWIFSEDKILV